MSIEGDISSTFTTSEITFFVIGMILCLFIVEAEVGQCLMNWSEKFFKIYLNYEIARIIIAAATM